MDQPLHLAKHPTILLTVHSIDGTVTGTELQESDQGFLLQLSGGTEAHRQAIVTWAIAYTQKCPVRFPLPLQELPEPVFSNSVLEMIAEIPWGKTLTYGEIALQLGKGGAARGVGQACGRNPFPLVIPCHRVIAAGSHLGGFSCGKAIKRHLLHFEEIAIKEVCYLSKISNRSRGSTKKSLDEW